MSIFPLAVLIALSFMAFAIAHLQQSFFNYYDFVAFAVVIGGTFSAGLVVLPWALKQDMVRLFKNLFVSKKYDYSKVATDCLKTINGTHDFSSNKSLYEKILKDGKEMIELGLDKSMTARVLKERINNQLKRQRKIANAVKSWSSYPPAFGLIGTVIGLVNVMRGISLGAQTQDTSLHMAIALVATMYGLLLSNLIIRPAGENMAKTIAEDEHCAEIALVTIGLMYDKTPMVDSQELINSYLLEEDRVDVLKDVA